jgi:hypothetical protein
MKYYLIGLVFFAGILAACNNASNKTTTTSTDTSKSQADTLMSEVMDGHDEGMAKYGKLNAMEKKIQGWLDSLQTLKDKSAAMMRPRLDSLLAEVRSAKQGMDTWMESFNMDSAVNDMNQRIRYLSEEKIKVGKVRDNILNVLRKTDSLFRNK